ncbi:MAG: hypothetical protein ACRYFK_12075 [Janthinobacterium lividum]
MKARVLAILFLVANSLAGQATPFTDSLLKLDGLPRRASKAQLTQRLGQPTKSSRARYECGSDYVDSPGHIYYLLRYAQATYVGNAAEGYELETVHFAPGGAVLHYGPATWNASTTLAAVQKLFGTDAELEKNLVPGTVLVSIAIRLPHTNQLADSRIHLTFRHGRLVEYTTWDPC